jgi:hypothetical protein
VNENLVNFLRQKADVFPFERDIELERFLVYTFDQPGVTLPVPAKIFLADEIAPQGYGFPVMKAPALDDLVARLDRWIDAEIAARAEGSDRKRPEAALKAYRNAAVSLARNALDSSILADYHSVFWLVHSADLARAFTAMPRRAMSAAQSLNRDAADALKYTTVMRWSQTMRDALPEITSAVASFVNVDSERKIRFLRLLTDNPLLIGEEFVDPDLRELRSYFSGHLRRDFAVCRKWFDSMRSAIVSLMRSDRLFRRAVMLLGYADAPPSLVTMVDPRVQQLVAEHPSFLEEVDTAFFEQLGKRLLEFLVVYHLRRGIIWMHTTTDGDNVADDPRNTALYSRAIRPMNFGRRGIVEPIVYRFGLVYDITSFTETLGEVARGGQGEEQASYRQMLEFQRDLAEITSRHALQFEKFLGDGAFYTCRRATRTLHAAIDVQAFYAASRSRGFAFNKGMRIALNYGYYRLLPMQVSNDGGEIKEFYGPGIVELSRLTSGKATKEIEDIQHLLLSHGYDQLEVYRFFAPLARGSDQKDVVQQREFYAYVNENGHLINEGIVASIPFLRQLSTEMTEDDQRIYRLRTAWASYLGIPASDATAYLGIRLLGSVSLKGIGSTEIAEVVRLNADEADISLVDEKKPFLQLLQQERNRTAASAVNSEVESDVGVSDLVVCQSLESAPVILVGEWDPVSEEVRRPIRLDAERYGLAIPITAESVESQSVAYQKLYRTLSRMDTLPNFSVDAVRRNANFSAFIIGATVEQL